MKRRGLKVGTALLRAVVPLVRGMPLAAATRHLTWIGARNTRHFRISASVQGGRRARQCLFRRPMEYFRAGPRTGEQSAPLVASGPVARPPAG